MSDNKEKPQPDGLDPDIAELLQMEMPQADERSGADTGDQAAEGGPEFTEIFVDEKEAPQQTIVVDGTKKSFDVIARLQEEPKPFFQDPEYYKSVLAGEGDPGQRVHEILAKYMKTEDPEEKSTQRAKLITAFQELGSSIAARAGGELSLPKRLLLRFGILSPGFLTTELRDMVSRIVFQNQTGEPVWYIDEWLQMISKGQVRPSSTDEVKQKGKDTSQKVVEAVEKKRGQRDNELTILRGRMAQLDEQEAALREQVDALLRHEFSEEYEGFKMPFGGAQKQALSQIQEILRHLSALDSQIVSSYSGLSGVGKDLESLERRSEGITPASAVDSKTVESEYGSVRQMAKLSVGKKGNHFPIFITQYIQPNLRDIGTRENVINEMAAVEALDPGLFLRTHKGQTSRIVPNTLLVPSYGETGVCWEPFEKFNRSTSRGRIAIPMFPKSLRLAILTALADLRWQVAKEKAQYYWMEEGITGKYYQWFSANKLRGDVREYFIRDYLLWITKESQGMQKLDKDVRGFFWRMMPFPQEIKENLKNRGFFYSELYKKDQNIARSDGY